MVIVQRPGLYRELLESALADHPATHVVGTYDAVELVGEQVASARPDVAVLEVESEVPGNSIRVGLLLRETLPGVGLVFLSAHARLEPEFFQSLREQNGGWCYLLKKSVPDLEALIRAIDGAAAGLVVVDPLLLSMSGRQPNGAGPRLTPRQREILRLMAQGLSNAAIARRLLISPKSLEHHINLLYGQLGIDRKDRSLNPRVKSVLVCLRDGWDSSPNGAV